jgi:hypothetical protein
MTFFEDFNHFASLPSKVISLAESLRPFDALRPVWEGAALSAGFATREVRLDDSVGRNDCFESSSLSENIRDFFMGDFVRVAFGIADGSKLGFALLRTGCAVMLVVLPMAYWRPVRSRLLLLSIGSGLLVSSVLLPAPLMIFGASLLRKKSSISVLVVLVKLLLRLDGVQTRLSDVFPALAERPMLAVLTEP